MAKAKPAPEPGKRGRKPKAFSPEKQDTLRKASGVTVFVRYASVYEQTDPGMINIMNGLPANRPPMTKQQIKEATEVADRMRELL